MKRIRRLLFAFFCLGVFALSVLYVLSVAFAPTMREPLTMEELDRIAETLSDSQTTIKTPVSVTQSPEGFVAPESETEYVNEDESDSFQTAETPTSGAHKTLEAPSSESGVARLPYPLVRVATDEERAEFAARKTQPNAVQSLAISAFTSPIGSFLLDAGARGDKGRARGLAINRAEVAFLSHDWDSARRYYSEAFEMRPDPHIAAYLAWMEDDPELVERYLEIAVSGESWANWVAHDLARVTGSSELATYFLERIQELKDPKEEKTQEKSLHAKAGTRI